MDKLSVNPVGLVTLGREIIHPVGVRRVMMT
jgi:hypothetical protein